MIQRLDRYRTPPSWHPGAPWLLQTLWFCLFAPLLAARWLPGSNWRVALLRAFGERIGSSCRLKPGLRVKFPWRLVVGDHCWLAEDAWIDNLAPVTLGDRVCLSQGVYLCTGNHDFRSPGFDLILGPITIGSEAWIAARAVMRASSPTNTCARSSATLRSAFQRQNFSLQAIGSVSPSAAARPAPLGPSQSAIPSAQMVRHNLPARRNAAAGTHPIGGCSP